MKKKGILLFGVVVAHFYANLAFGHSYIKNDNDIKPLAETKAVFKATILKKQCIIEVGQNSATVNKIELGRIVNHPGQRGNIVPVQFRFSDCAPNQTIQSITYKTDVGSGTNEGVNHGYVTVQNNSVRVYLYEDADARIPFKTKSFGSSGDLIVNNQWMPVFYAQLRVPPEGATASEGSIETTAQIVITYQ